MINTNYRLLFIAYLLSSIGDWLYRLAIPFLIYQKTQSALYMAIAYGITFLPFILITPFGGVFADRFDKKMILMYGDLLAGLFTLLFAIATDAGMDNTILICIFVFIVASISAIHHPAHQSIIPSIVPKKSLATANSYLHTTDNVIDLAGPLIGGSIIALFGVINAIYINAVSFLLSFSVIYFLKYAVANLNTTDSDINVSRIMDDLKKGFYYAWQNQIIKYGCLLFVFINFALSLFYANFMFYLVDVLKLTPNQVGLTIAISGIGAIIGSLVAPYITRYFSEGIIIVTCTLFSGVTALSLLSANHYIQVGSIWGVISASNSIVVVSYFTLRQKSVNEEYLGRAVASTRMVSFIAIPLAALVGGWIMQENNDIQLIIILMSIILITSGIFGYFTPLSKVQRMEVE